MLSLPLLQLIQALARFVTGSVLSIRPGWRCDKELRLAHGALEHENRLCTDQAPPLRAPGITFRRQQLMLTLGPKAPSNPTTRVGKTLSEQLVLAEPKKGALDTVSLSI